MGKRRFFCLQKGMSFMYPLHQKASFFTAMRTPYLCLAKIFVSMTVQLRILTQKHEMLPLLPLIQQLSPGLTLERYTDLLDDMLAHGYRMVAVFEGETCTGLSGFWVITKIYSGKYLEMDNVVVDVAHRSKGIGKLMSDFLSDLARREGCETMMLDAYLENEKAHAFYEREGFTKRGYHFLKRL